jgi:cation-transporting ATPase I
LSTIKLPKLPNPISEINSLVAKITTTGRSRRRVWKGNNRLHLEVKGVHKLGKDALINDLESGIKKLKGVDWAEVNAITGRVVVALSEGEDVDVEDVVDLVEDIEEAHDVHNEKFPHDRPEHPGDNEPFNRNLLALSADLFGIGAGIMGQAIRLTPIPAEIASIISLLDNEPRLRRLLENRFGHSATDLTLGILNAIGQGLSQGPLGLIVDATHRSNLLVEIKSRQRIWLEKEVVFTKKKGASKAEALEHSTRPCPLPSGPVERYSDIASIASIGAFGALFGITRSPRKAANAIAAGLPKAARLGRESFAAQLARILSTKGALIMNSTSLRKLDRVNCVVLDSASFVTGRWHLEECEAFDDKNQETLARLAISAFDPVKMIKPGAKDRVKLVTPENVSNLMPKGYRNLIRKMSAPGCHVLACQKGDVPMGLVKIVPEIDPNCFILADCATDCNLEVIIGGARSGLASVLGISTTVRGGARLGSSIRELQSDKKVVMLISDGNQRSALAAADVSIGIFRGNGEIPWGADIICDLDMDQIYRVLRAIKNAKEVSQTSVALAGAGSSVGAVWAVIGPSSTAGNRAVLPVNVAALVSQLIGILQATSLERLQIPKPPAYVAWHAMEVKDVLKTLQSSAAGLSPERAAKKRVDQSKRDITLLEKAGKSFAAELANPMTPVLAVGAALSAATGSIADAALVGGVTAANALIGAVQRLRTEASIEKLKNKSAVPITVVRNSIPKRESGPLVMGDVVEIKDGDVVPADLRIIESSHLEVDEAFMTGEPYPVYKDAKASAALSVSDRTSMLYEGTSVVAGKARGVVVAVGDDTQAGRALSGISQAPGGGVEERLKKLMKITIPLTAASGALVTGFSLLWQRPVREAVSSGVNLTVASVPEGLPMLANLAQLASANRLSNKNALVRNPRTIEALGRVDMLCFDKTGTLTTGAISLSYISDGKSSIEINYMEESHKKVLAAALRASPLPDADHEIPHATDKAVIDAGLKYGVSQHDFVNGWSQIEVLAFLPSRGFHAVIGSGGKENFIMVKGAPEIILPRCEYWDLPDGSVKLTKLKRSTLENIAEAMALSGLRVLAVAQRKSSSNDHLDEKRISSMHFLGFLGLSDSVRPTAKDAVNKLAKAGVSVCIITGDHPETTKAIAMQLGILKDSNVLTGAEIESLCEAELEEAVGKTAIYSRVTPAQKVRIVKAYQKIGKVVAMTGDGANDAAAIMTANVGIALGKRGSRAAVNAADLVVSDDRLETILDAIIEGRAMWTSVRDALSILIGGNIGEVAFTVASTAITGRSALNTRQLLLVNLMTDMLPALTIALRPPKNFNPEDLLNEGPDVSLGRALARDIAIRATTTSLATIGAWSFGRATGLRKRADTIALATLVTTQLTQSAFLGINSPTVLASTLASMGILTVVVQTPVISQYFGCSPLDPIAWGAVLGVSSLAAGLSVTLPLVGKILLSKSN